jgi:flagellar motor switch protein FliN/FliY
MAARGVYDGRAMSTDDDSSTPSPIERLAVLRSMPIEVQVHLGRAFLTLKDVLNLEQGSMIELTKLSSEPPLDVVLNGRIVGHGTAVSMGDQLGVRITEMVPTEDELPSLPAFLHPREGDPVPFRLPKKEPPLPFAGQQQAKAPGAGRPADDDVAAMLDSDQHPLALALAKCAKKAGAITAAAPLSAVLPRLEMFVEPLNAVLFGQPASHFTTTGDVLEMRSPGEWADALLKDWLDEVCGWYADAVVGGTELNPGPAAIAGLLRELHDGVFGPLAEHLYVEIILVLTPLAVDPNRMKVVDRLATGGSTACAVRAAGLVVGQRVIRQASVIVG